MTAVIDPRLMVSALVNGDSVDKVMNFGKTVTGPVLECCLVSMAPRVLLPRGARFIGSVWDDRAKTMTVRLSGKGRFTVGLAHSQKPVSVKGACGKATVGDGRMFYPVQLNGEGEIVFGFRRKGRK